METLRLSNGVLVPYIGLGTGGKFSTSEEIEKAVEIAIEIGYRHIDTAMLYDNEKAVGNGLENAIRKGLVKRNDLFITTKLPPYANRPELVERTLRTQLKLLRLDYVDLYLIHSPVSLMPTEKCYSIYLSDSSRNEHDHVDLAKTWEAMEYLYALGLTRAIGLSNFNVEQLQYIYQSAKVKPHNLQIEVHVHFPQKELHILCTSLNISVTAYAPLGCPSKKGIDGWPEEVAIDDPTVIEIARKYEKTPAQILLRHLIQRQIIVIPKSVNPQRIEENFEIFDFKISEEDMERLNSIEPRRRLYTWEGKGYESHPDYPFTEVLAGRRKSEH